MSRCKNETNNNKCASTEEINKFLFDKYLGINSFNYKPSLKNYDKTFIAHRKDIDAI